MGMVYPEETVGDDGVPGCRSTNQLPSSRIRARILSVASRWIGRPPFVISIVTTPVLPTRSIELTVPTSTPATRTGDLGLMFTAVEKTPFRRKPCLNGMCLVKPKNTTIAMIASTRAPTRVGFARPSSTTGVRS